MREWSIRECRGVLFFCLRQGEPERPALRSKWRAAAVVAAPALAVAAPALAVPAPASQPNTSTSTCTYHLDLAPRVSLAQSTAHACVPLLRCSCWLTSVSSGDGPDVRGDAHGGEGEGRKGLAVVRGQRKLTPSSRRWHGLTMTNRRYDETRHTDTRQTRWVNRRAARHCTLSVTTKFNILFGRKSLAWCCFAWWVANANQGASLVESSGIF